MADTQHSSDKPLTSPLPKALTFPTWLPWLALVIVQVNYSFLPAAQKVLLHSLAPGELLAVRMVASALFFVLLESLIHGSRGTSRFASRALRLPWYLPVLGAVANQGLLIVGISLTSSTIAAIIIPSITTFTYAFALMRGDERWSLSMAAGLLLGMLGMVMLTLVRNEVHVADTKSAATFLIGVICCVGAAATFAGFLVLSRPFIQSTPRGTLGFTTDLFVQSAIYSLPLIWLLGRSDGSLIPAVALSAPGSWFWPALIFTILGPTVLNYMLNGWALTHLPASAVSGLICLQAVLGSIWGTLILGEVFTIWHVISCVLICGGVIVLVRATSPTTVS